MPSVLHNILVHVVQGILSADAVMAVCSPLLGNYLSWASYLNIKSNIINPGYASQAEEQL